MSLFLITCHDGSVRRMRLTAKTTPQTEIAKMPLAEQLQFKSVRQISEDELPADPSFRPAWRCHGPGNPLSIDMAHARDIHRERMRVARAPLLAKLDIEYQRADEAGDAERKRQIATDKQALRDVTQHPDLEAAQTPAELTAVWPGLPERPAPPAATLPSQETGIVPAPPELTIIPVPAREPFALSELLARAGKDTGEAIEIPPLPPPPEPVLPPPLPPAPVDTALSEASRKQAAKALVRTAVADVNRRTADEHFRYELALLVHNKNVDAMNDMKLMAAAEGTTVETLAERIIATHNARRRRASQVYAMEAQALIAIDKASGDDIDTIASDAARAIRNGDDE